MKAVLTYIQGTGFVFYTGSTSGAILMGQVAFLYENWRESLLWRSINKLMIKKKCFDYLLKNDN